MHQQQQLAAYRLAVFNAFSDVETQLGQSSSDTDQLAALTEEVRASGEAFRISELQYREGTIDIVSLLNNQQNLFTAQQSLVQTRLAKLEAYIALYNSLGGGCVPWRARVSCCSVPSAPNWNTSPRSRWTTRCGKR